jgi:hypothetical protein
MARVERQGATFRVVAESAEETALLCHGRDQGGAVTLLEGFYAVRGNSLLLPARSTASIARRVCAAFERAALAHEEARRRRGRFRLVKSEPCE